MMHSGQPRGLREHAEGHVDAEGMLAGVVPSMPAAVAVIVQIQQRQEESGVLVVLVLVL